MIAKLTSSLAFVFVLGLVQWATADTALTKADIPANLPPELRAIVEETFSKKAEDRSKALSRFEKMGEKAAPTALFMVRLLYDQDSEVACLAAIILEKKLEKYSAVRNAPGLVADLIRASRSTKPEVRARVALLLGRTRNIAARRALEGLLEDSVGRVRLAAIDAFGKSSDPDADRALWTVLRKTCKKIDDNVREACEIERALGKVGATQAAASPGKGRFASFVLSSIIENWDIDHMYGYCDIREGAIEGIGVLQDRRTIPLLRCVVASNRYMPYKVRAAAATALAKVAARDAAQQLKSVALDVNEVRCVRFAAALGLVEVTNGEVDDVGVVDTLNRCNTEEGLDEPMLSIAQHGKTREVRRAAASWIASSALSGKMNNVELFDAISRFPSHGDSNAPGLLEIVKHGKTKEARWAAAIIIVTLTHGKVGDPDIVEAIRLSPDASKADGALLAVARHGTTKAVRAAAQRYLPKASREELREDGLLVTPQEVADEAKQQKDKKK